jgi:hypothetical protein
LYSEYILIRDINDLPEHAHELGRLINNSIHKSHILLNLIPYNPTSVAEDYRPPTEESIQTFLDILISDEYKIHTRVRQEKGQDISGACGQLALNGVVNKNKGKNTDFEDFGRTSIPSIVSSKKNKNYYWVYCVINLSVFPLLVISDIYFSK